MSKKFKDLLKEGEEQFDAKAWEQLASRLDQIMPVSKPFFKSNWMFGLSTIASVLVVGFYFLIYDNSSNNVDPTTKQMNQEPRTNTRVIIKQKVSSEFKTLVVRPKSKVSQVDSKSIREKKWSEHNLSPSEGKALEVLEYHPKVEPRKDEVFEKEVEPVFPEVKISYCLNEKVSIKNPNAANLLLVNEQLDQIVIPTNSTKTISLEQAGAYTFVYYTRSEKRYEQEAFFVSANKHLAIQSNEEVVYENGIPYIEVSSKDFSEQTSWKTSKGAITEQKETTKLRCFDKGIYTVSLILKADNNCFSEGKIELTVKDQYNLLAVNAFVPSDINPKNRAFMPEALKYRQTGFKLVILDSKDQHLVYQTESADAPWDGIDQLTGKLVDANKLFIWKVDLKQPELKERGEYSGTVVRL